MAEPNASELRASIVKLVASRGYEYRDEPFELSAGQLSHDYVDGKLAMSRGSDLLRVGQAVLELTRAHGVDFVAAGGLTMGADPIAHALAVVGDKAWFSVLKEQKDHGKRQQVVGFPLEPGTPVLLLDDVATSGRSILQAYDAVLAYGVEVVMAVTLVDRGDRTRQLFGERGVLYEPILTYEDLDIAPVVQPVAS